MAIFENVSLGLRGVLLRNGDRVWLEPGETLEMAAAAILLKPHGVEEQGAKASEPRPTPAPTPDPLDHDGDGKKGGSEKGDQSTAAKGRRRKGRA